MTYQTQYRTWVLDSQQDWIRFFDYATSHPEDSEAAWLLEQVSTHQFTSTISNWFEDWYRTNQALEASNQSGDYSQLYKDLTQSGTSIDPNLDAILKLKIKK